MHLETEKHQKPRGAHKFWLEFWYTGKSDKIQNIVTCPFQLFYLNTPGTAGGPGGRDRTLAVKNRKNVRKITFFS